MRLNFSHILLITCLILLAACQHGYIKTHFEGRNIGVSDSLVAMDTQILLMYLPYKQEMDKKMQRVISVSAIEMVKNRPESELTNFLADLLLEEGKQELFRITGNITPHLSYFNNGGIRTFLPKGDITVGKIFELMPFENEMVFLKLTGAQVHEFLNNVAEKGGESLGGVRFVISDNKATNIIIDEKPLSFDGEYWLVTNDYIALGGDGHDVLSQRLDFIEADVSIRDVIIRYLEKKHQDNEMISAKKDGRIIAR
jgi:2',3'-cyclic-nucleotide 2'-phosphodiesterase (5'-nucleotidase family)